MAAYRDKRSGRWRYRKWLTLPCGRRERIWGTPAIDSKKAALDAEETHVRRVTGTVLVRSLEPRQAETRKEVPTFRDFVMERWLPTYPAAAGNRARTIAEKEWHVHHHLLPHLGERPLDGIRGEVLDRLFAKLHKNLSPKSVKNVRATLGTILRSAKRWDVIGEVPELPRVKVPEQEWDWLTADESRKLIDAAVDQDERALLMFALHTGARFGEQRALSWGDLDWQNRLVLIRRSMPHNTNEAGPTKSGKERRIPMSDTLHAQLKRIRELRHLLGGIVFARRKDGGPLSLYAMTERLQRACRRAGLREIRWHDLRHSFASQLVAAGVPLRQVQDWLGHSTINMTMRYAHLAPGSGIAIRALDSISWATGGQHALGQQVGNTEDKTKEAPEIRSDFQCFQSDPTGT